MTGTPEPYALSIAPGPARALTNGPPRGLPLSIATAVYAFLTGPLLDNPHRVGKPLERELSGHHSARRGAYRVLYRIDDAQRQVHVVRVEHRAGVYRPR